MGELTGMLKFSGKVGDTVGYQSNGRNLVRKAPRRAGEPKSEAQKRQRERWRELAAIAKTAGVWQKSHISGLKISAYSNVIKHNAAYLSSDEADMTAVSLPCSYFDKALSVSDLSLSGRKLSATISSLGACDEAFLLVYEPKTHIAVSEIVKEPGSLTLDIAAPIASGDKVYLYVQGGKGHELTESTASEVISA